jgi:hypothetical protein
MLSCVIILSVFMVSVSILSVIMLSVIMLSVIMLSIVMLSVIMLSVVMLNVVAPLGTNDLTYYDTASMKCIFLPLGAKLELLMEQHALKIYKQLFEYQHLLLLRDIWWSKF